MSPMLRSCDNAFTLKAGSVDKFSIPPGGQVWIPYTHHSGIVVSGFCKPPEQIGTTGSDYKGMEYGPGQDIYMPSGSWWVRNLSPTLNVNMVAVDAGEYLRAHPLGRNMIAYDPSRPWTGTAIEGSGGAFGVFSKFGAGYAQARAGRLWVGAFTNVTSGSSLAGPLLVIYRAAAGTRRLVLRSLTLSEMTAGPSGSDWTIRVWTSAVDPAPSGGAAVTPYCPDRSVSPAPVADFTAKTGTTGCTTTGAQQVSPDFLFPGGAPGANTIDLEDGPQIGPDIGAIFVSCVPATGVALTVAGGFVLVEV